MAANFNITIKQGADFVLAAEWQDSDLNPIDITGFSIRMQARVHVAAPGTFLDMNTGNGQIVITDAAAGKFELRLTNVETAAMGLLSGVYDLEIVSPSGTVDRVLEGSIAVSPEVTR